MNLMNYLLASSLLAAALWAVYRGLLSNWRDFRAGRTFLLIAVFAVPVLPLLREAAPVRHSRLHIAVALPEYVVSPSGPGSEAARRPDAMILLYAAVATLLLTRQVCLAFRIRRIVRQGTLRAGADCTIAEHTGIGPGTLGKTIFLPGAAAEPRIVSHEIGHIRAGHRFDLLLVNISCCLLWINPAIWLLRRELRLVHEFEADRFATRPGEDPEAYAGLLMQYVLGARAAAFTHGFFHHPIKQRITMLFASKPSRRERMRRMISVSFAAALIGAGTLLVQCKPEKTPEPLTVTFSQPDAEPSGALKWAETMPAFNGDLSNYLVSELRYPDAARKAGLQGRAVLQFVVTDKGRITDVKIVKSSGHELLDGEALRVVRAMPDWKPGQDRGKAVSVYFSLPITFMLDETVALARKDYRSDGRIVSEECGLDEYIRFRSEILN